VGWFICMPRRDWQTLTKKMPDVGVYHPDATTLFALGAVA
jgi:hypothetical protein